MEELLSIANGLPRRALQPGEVLLVNGDSPRALYVLLEGQLRIEKDGVAVAVVGEPGACVGEMSLLLGIPVTADVVAVEGSVLAVLANADAMLEDEGGLTLTLALARLLAARLQVMTTYLADIKKQYNSRPRRRARDGRCGARQHHGSTGCSQRAQIRTRP